MFVDEDKYLEHYGVLRRSGRYPYGSGGPEHASNKGFLDYVDSMRRQGLNDTEISKAMGISRNELQAARSIAKTEEKKAQITQIERMKARGMSNVAIGKQLDMGESQVRSLLAPGQKEKLDQLHATSDMLKRQVEEKKYVDIGGGVEHLPNAGGVSSSKLNAAVAVLKEQGYEVRKVKIDQVSTGHQTEVKVLCPPGTTQKEVWMNRDKIRQIQEFTEDGGLNFYGIKDPLSISSKRVGIRYKEDGGAEADGVIYVRPGVKDVSLGQSNYAQVRIAVDGTHYLKGMAIYKDDLPAGHDLVFNTNKSKAETKTKHDAMKPLKDDPDNPFGSMISRQIGDLGPDGKLTKLTSVMNVVNEQGDWETWSRSLSSQILSKQSPKLAKDQLNMTFERRKSQLDEIMALTNPAVRRRLLEDFAEDVDSAAVHLKAASLPRQSNRVILPVTKIKETEVYARGFRDGERVVLIRHPHGGPFEIPELTVNNRNPEAKRLLGSSQDAIGIHSEVAKRLSGADFDGDAVIVVPNNQGKIKTQSPLTGLRDFDPGIYKQSDESKRMNPRTKQIEMGVVSNLITDMTIRGASPSELARAVRHSMVVIDAEKHNLDYRASAIDNGIKALKDKYQTPFQATGRPGASTLISRAGSEKRVPERKQGFRIDRKTGEKIFTPTNATYVDRAGKTIVKTTKSTKLAEARDAHSLSSGTVVEKVYADHSNRLKAMANQARREAVNTKTIPYSPSAKKAYDTEVSALNAKLNIAMRNRPLERQANIIAKATIQAKTRAHPEMTPAELKKVSSQALTAARTRTGAAKRDIEITDREWEAIQAGAITNHKLTQILKNSDLKRVKELATPRTRLLMTSSKKARAEAMLAAGYTQAEVADHLGVSLTTLKTSIGGS